MATFSKKMRILADHPATPSAGSLDAQSVMVKQSVGYDGAKKIKGRKRFTLVDTLGLLMAVHVVAANVPEREGAKPRLGKVQAERSRWPRRVRIGGDGGFSGKDFLHWVMDTFRLILDVVLRPE